MFQTLLTHCAPCAGNDLTRMAVEVVDDVPLCGVCAYDVRQHRLLAVLNAEEAASVSRPGLPVPSMTLGDWPTPVE